METTAYEYETERLDHLGIVAGICNQIELAKVIDESLPTPSGRKVSCGQATVAMVLNALGLTGRALYLMPEYMNNKPVDILMGAGLKAKDFNDDTLGRSLDELFQAGITELFARVAVRAVTVFNIEYEYVHLDTSSFSLHGEYESEVAQEAVSRRGAIEVTHGYSKEKRPDLKQVVVSLITSQQSALPLWLEALDGNSSDKRSFAETVQAYCKQLETDELPWFVMDSAGYSKANLAQWDNVQWLTRVPETISEAKRALQSVVTEEMAALANGCRVHALNSDYGQVQQRWLVVYSPKAWEREAKRLDKQIARAGEKSGKELRRLAQAQFACEADARKAVQRLENKMKWHTVQAQYNPVKKHVQPGRPATGAAPTIVGWKVQGELAVKQEAIAQARRWLGRFILATNELDTERLSDSAMLAAYKAQGHSVEQGFRFLKDPMFFADSLFLKSPARIMAMIMVMGLALLVYALAERELRHQLKTQNETVPDQKGKPTQTPTMRRVAQMFEGVDVLAIRFGDQVLERRVLNLTKERLKILRLLGPAVENCYLVGN